MQKQKKSNCQLFRFCPLFLSHLHGHERLARDTNEHYMHNCTIAHGVWRQIFRVPLTWKKRRPVQRWCLIFVLFESNFGQQNGSSAMFGACCLLQCTANLPNKIFDCFSHLFELLIDSPNLANSNDNRNGLSSGNCWQKENVQGLRRIPSHHKSKKWREVDSIMRRRIEIDVSISFSHPRHVSISRLNNFTLMFLWIFFSRRFMFVAGERTKTTTNSILMTFLLALRKCKYDWPALVTHWRHPEHNTTYFLFSDFLVGVHTKHTSISLFSFSSAPSMWKWRARRDYPKFNSTGAGAVQIV